MKKNKTAPYLPETLPPPEPTLDDAVYWKHLAERRLTFQSCADCGKVRHPPMPLCPQCRSSGVAWVEAPSVGILFTYTVVHYAAHADVAAALPYNVAVVEFPELDHVRLVTNIVGAEGDALGIGMPVELVWEPFQDGWLPRFRPAGGKQEEAMRP